MKAHFSSILVGLLFVIVATAAAQSPPSDSAVVEVPAVIQFSNIVLDRFGNPLTGDVAITFALYNNAQGGEPLWSETQNVELDSSGHYSVYLGITKAYGLSATLFTTGQAHWLGVKVAGQEEQARVFLVSVPYAMKAGDAATVGGLPPSAFVLAAPPATSAASEVPAATSASAPASAPATTFDVTTTGGTANTFPLFTAATNIQNSILTQTGTTAINVLGKLNLPALGTATSGAGFNSRPLDFVSSVYNGTAAVTQTFQWQAETLNNDSTTATGTLNLLYASGTTAAEETGLKISSKGLFTFASGQTFPGTGTIAGVTAGSGLSGGGSSGSVTLTNTGILALTGGTGISIGSGQSPTVSVNMAQVPLLSAANSFTGNQTVTGNLSVTGSYQIGGVPFAFGSSANSNAFLGFAGSTGPTGTGNTAAGYAAILHGSGSNNTGVGLNALYNTGSGSHNTAVGSNAGGSNTTGSGNTLIGYSAGTDGTLCSGPCSNLTNATAIGAYADVAQSDSLVLGSISGINGASASVNVGIGTPFPYSNSQLTVQGYGPPTGLYGNTGLSAIGGSGDLTATGSEGAEGVNGAGGSGATTDGDGGFFRGGTNSSYGDGVDANAGSGYAGNFGGDVIISGNLSKSGGSFKIDHPLDPANKYLYHSFVESPDMMNVYNGNVVLDANGEAVVEFPAWFGVLNRDFRYQLACIGGFAPVYVAEEIRNNRFRIAGGKGGLKVSWQVTGIRQDAWANAHRIPVEEEKEPRLRGYYIHPDLYGAPPEKQIEWARHPETMKRMKEHREAQRNARMRPQGQTQSSSGESAARRPALAPEPAPARVMIQPAPTHAQPASTPVAPRTSAPPVAKPTSARPITGARTDTTPSAPHIDLDEEKQR